MVQTIELSFEFWNQLASQIIVISSLLSGFCIAIIANFLVSNANTRLTRSIMGAATLAAGSFLVSVFGMTKIVMMTTEGYPGHVVEADFLLPRIVATVAFILGIASLMTMISLAGWTKSKRMGIFTTVVGILTFLFLLKLN